MKPVNGNPDKNRKLIEERGTLFEEMAFSLQSGCLLDDAVHPSQGSYSHQRLFIVAIDDYAYLIPYVENDQEILPKTVVPSRKATKQHLGEQP